MAHPGHPLESPLASACTKTAGCEYTYRNYGLRVQCTKTTLCEHKHHNYALQAHAPKQRVATTRTKITLWEYTHQKPRGHKSMLHSSWLHGICGCELKNLRVVKKFSFSFFAKEMLAIVQCISVHWLHCQRPGNSIEWNYIICCRRDLRD